jgi:hypothetical protein
LVGTIVTILLPSEIPLDDLDSIWMTLEIAMA